jgi:hypothetical protein
MTPSFSMLSAALGGHSMSSRAPNGSKSEQAGRWSSAPEAPLLLGSPKSDEVRSHALSPTCASGERHDDEVIVLADGVLGFERGELLVSVERGSVVDGEREDARLRWRHDLGFQGLEAVSNAGDHWRFFSAPTVRFLSRPSAPPGGRGVPIVRSFDRLGRIPDEVA